MAYLDRMPDPRFNENGDVNRENANFNDLMKFYGTDFSSSSEGLIITSQLCNTALVSRLGEIIP